MTDRNTAMLAQWRTGFSISALARKYGLTQQRASQIINVQLGKLDPEEAARLLHEHPHQRPSLRGTRRIINANEAVRLWKQGFSAGEIAEKLSEGMETKFQRNSVAFIISQARKAGENLPRRSTRWPSAK
ncbi:hypothetical protein UFOVP470_39 [uncultured Caudovirales phage]|uniref:Uncharacterized protein n=1 Tax=uncultured Caudovirales phage TaxID=2100421 RepID=A0A6J5MED0_9CAUD|nr:hypothetical protein UFOVP470_39 [uncultured Caudovirales phage]